MADTKYRGYLISIKNNGESGSRLPITADRCYIGAKAGCDVRLVDADCEDRYCLIKFLHNKHVCIVSIYTGFELLDKNILSLMRIFYRPSFTVYVTKDRCS